MTSLIEAIIEAQGGQLARDPKFPHAPDDWSPDSTRRMAAHEGLKLTDEHWEIVRTLQAYFARHRETGINVRELRDALDEKFHTHGGTRYLYRLLPGGPIAQGCRLAGLPVPAGAVDKGFGSVV